MAVLKCKMCGGNIEIGENQNIGVCDSCGSTMTLPNVNDERILNLFDRANHFRLQNEFDKALAAYESILSEDNKNAEAHWGCVLAKYGIEYVEDPKTHKRVPTCHRVQNESVLSDLDYKAAVEFSDDISVKNLYKQEAEAIAEMQKNILSIANNESPYDVFICYKETDNSGRRTVDSTLAQDIYYQLTNEGYKVFFSRITLEDKLGTEYEPYIFSALNSAKVMLVVGTNKDYFNAVWVKNEWARFLDLARKDKSKMIIPCYRDMDAYDLPDELSMFQSQDMGKIGFVQDLIRGIKKVLQKEAAQPTVAVVNNTAEAFDSEALLKRAFMLLEDAEWQKADELLEQVLNHEPENAKAYVGKLMIDVKVNKEENLGKRLIDFSGNLNYKKAIRFGDDNLKDRLQKYCESAKKLYEQDVEKKAKSQKEKKNQEIIQRYRQCLLSIKKCAKAMKLILVCFPVLIPMCIGSVFMDGPILAVISYILLTGAILLFVFAADRRYTDKKYAQKLKKEMDEKGIIINFENKEATRNITNSDYDNESNLVTKYPCPACDKCMNLEGDLFICPCCGYTVQKGKITFFNMQIAKVAKFPEFFVCQGTVEKGILSVKDEVYINGKKYEVRGFFGDIKQATEGMRVSVMIENPNGDEFHTGDFIKKI